MLLIGLFTGITSALIASMLNDWMEYGNILYKVRLWFIKRSMNRQGVSCETLCQIDEQENFEDRQVVFDEIGWQLAMNDFWLTGWLCVVCMATRVNVLFIALVVGWLLKNQVGLDIIFVNVITSFAVCHFVIKKI